MSDTLEKNSHSLAEILEENNETQEIENQETVQENNIENNDTEVDAENAPTEE